MNELWITKIAFAWIGKLHRFNFLLIFIGARLAIPNFCHREPSLLIAKTTA
jgi:hypothetical protein